MNQEQVKRFGQELMRRYGEAMTVLLVDLGDRTGLLAATAQGGTSQEIATRAGLAERPVREWLHGMVVGGIVEHEAGSFRLPPEHGALLVGATPYNLAPLARAAAMGLGRAERLEEALRSGAGIPGDELHDGFTDVVDRMSRYRFDALLAEVYLPAAGDVHERLRAKGGRVADVGCGSGHAANLMARALPQAEVVGFDAYAPGLAQARTEAERLGLTNVRFEAADMATVATEGPFDLVTAFDVIHDLGDPTGALAAIREALVADGVFLLYDIGAPSDLDEQVALPWAPLMYGFSLAYCVQGALADGGDALGNMWGRERAEAMLRDAGFDGVDVVDPPLDPINVLYVCRP